MNAGRGLFLSHEPARIATVSQTTASTPLNLGFLTVLHEASGYLGGYLVTNTWGRPLEFRLSTAVQPNRVQQILYGGTLQPYIYADLIGKTLVEKTGTPVQMVLTDREPVLELRLSLEVPVVWLAPAGDPLAEALAAAGAEVRSETKSRRPVFCHPRFAGDLPFVRETLQRLEDLIDLTEPFARIRDAIAEARKMGVTSRN
jgi:hypothetical protein